MSGETARFLWEIVSERKEHRIDETRPYKFDSPVASCTEILN